ncbi:MAG: HAMP domain-containing protein, partial [Planctomycetes bacterium]|nr:HAMP domain-containing protein [Planctomycetota bacterium]
EGVRFYLLLETDTTLDAEVQEVILAIEAQYPEVDRIIEELRRKAEGHKDRGWHIRWMNEDRSETIWSSENAPAKPLQNLIGSNVQHNVWGSSEFRSIERTLDRPGLPKYFVRVGTPISFVTDNIDRVTRIIAPVGLFIFLLAPLGGFFMAGQAIEPLQKIIRTTDRLRPSHLDERLQVGRAGDELDQLASKINTFLDQIADHLKKNREFVANAAHELRSPLAAIQTSIEVSLEKPRTPAEHEETLFLLNDQCRHLSQLVNQMLQLAQSDAGATDQIRELLPLPSLIERKIEMFGPVAEEKGVTLRSGRIDNVTLSANRNQIRQLLTNLVDNAIKYTSAPGVVEISVIQNSETNEVELAVSDTGIGIPPESLHRVFDRFYQVDKSRKRGDQTRGNGLG